MGTSACATEGVPVEVEATVLFLLLLCHLLSMSVVLAVA